MRREQVGGVSDKRVLIDAAAQTFSPAQQQLTHDKESELSQLILRTLLPPLISNTSSSSAEPFYSPRVIKSLKTTTRERGSCSSSISIRRLRFAADAAAQLATLSLLPLLLSLDLNVVSLSPPITIRPELIYLLFNTRSKSSEILDSQPRSVLFSRRA